MRRTPVSGRVWMMRRKWSSTGVWWARRVQRESCCTDPRDLPLNRSSVCLSGLVSPPVCLSASLFSLLICVQPCVFFCTDVHSLFLSESSVWVVFLYSIYVQRFVTPLACNKIKTGTCLISKCIPNISHLQFSNVHYLYNTNKSVWGQILHLRTYSICVVTESLCVWVLRGWFTQK